jgi:carboxypeptidase D
VWRDRRRRAGYKGLGGGAGEGRESLIAGMGLENFRHRERERDVEAADFDERELDEVEARMNGHGAGSRNGAADAKEAKLHAEGGQTERRRYHQDGDADQGRYSLGEASSSDGEGERPVREKA